MALITEVVLLGPHHGEYTNDDCIILNKPIVGPFMTKLNDDKKTP
jgi:hypothetical protein